MESDLVMMSPNSLSNQNNNALKNVSPSLEHVSYLTTLLSQKNQIVQTQTTQIIQMKSSVAKDLEVIDKLDQAVPIEEKKFEILVSKYQSLSNKFQKLQAEMNEHLKKEEHYKSVLRDTDQELYQMSFKRNEMRLIIDQSTRQKDDISNHIFTLENSWNQLNNDIYNLISCNEASVKAKEDVNTVKLQLNDESKKIEELRKKQNQMKECLLRTETQIQEFQALNLRAELELYDVKKRNEEMENKINEYNFQIESKEQIEDNLLEYKQKFIEKEILLNKEKSINQTKKDEIRIRKQILLEKRKRIQDLKKSLKSIEILVLNEQENIELSKQQHAACQINAAQFTAKVDNSVNEMKILKKKKKAIKKRLIQTESYAIELQDKIQSAECIANCLRKERDSLQKMQTEPQPIIVEDDFYDDSRNAVQIMKNQKNCIQQNRRNKQFLDFDQNLLGKRIANIHSDITMRQNKRRSYFPTVKKNRNL